MISQAYERSIRDGIPFWDLAYPRNEQYVISPTYKNNPNLMKDYFKISKGPYWFGNYAQSIPHLNKYYKPQGGRPGIKALNGKDININFAYTDLGQLNGTSSLSFVLDDGTIIVFYTSDGNDNLVYIDVNGAKAPNTFGRDIYFFTRFLLDIK